MVSLFSKVGSACWLVLILALSACADDGGDDTPDSHEQNTYPVVPRPAPDLAPYDDITELVIKNQTTRAVYKLFVAPSESETWGPDVLGTKMLNPGGTASFLTERCDAYYDLKAVDILGNLIARVNRLYFGCGKRQTITLLVR